MADLTILSFDIYEYHRDELAKMSDKELYDLYINDEDDKIGAYDIDEFTCALNDETIDDQHNWFFSCDFDKATGKDIDIMERLETIKREHGDIVSALIPKAIKNGQTIYGELSDWLRDYHNDLPLKERDMLAKLLLGDMVVQHPDYISRVKPSTLMVLCSYDNDDNDTDVHLVVSKHQFDTDKERVREAIEGMWDLDLYTEEDMDELRECISNLLQGDNGYFGSEYYWEEKDCVL